MIFSYEIIICKTYSLKIIPPQLTAIDYLMNHEDVRYKKHVPPLQALR